MSATIAVRKHNLNIPPFFSQILHRYHSTVGQHVRQTSLLAHVLAGELQLGEQEISLIGLAALLHDIGKIAIPIALLNKPGPLTAEEWVLMRRHPQIGSQLLQSAGGRWASAAPLVLAHHERWDGQGYPDKKAREAIPLGARILAIADAYAAMTEPRSYRQALTSTEARLEIQRCAGSLYDPHLTAVFLRLLKQKKFWPG